MNRIALVLLVGALAQFGCDDEPDAEPDTGAPDEVTAASSAWEGEGDHGGGHVEPARAPWVAGQAQGQVQIDGQRFRSRTPLHGGELIVVAEGAVLALETDENAHYELQGPATAFVGAHVGAEFFLLSGSVYVTLSTSAPIRALQRVAGPAATTTTRGSGEFWVSVLPSGATWTAALSIPVEVSDGTIDDEGALVRTSLESGTAVLATDAIQEITQGPANNERAAETFSALVPVDRPVAPAQRRRRISRDLTRLTEALDQFGAELTRGEQLQTDHRAAVAAGTDTEARALQSQIVAHASRRAVLSQAVLATWERVRARSRLLELAEEEVPEGVTAAQGRVAELLGR